MRALLLTGFLVLCLPNPASAADPFELRLVLQVDDKAALDETAEVVRRRLEDAGIDADVDTGRDGRIVVDVPRIDDPKRVRRLLQGNAALEFRFARWPEEGGGAVTREAVIEHFGGQIPDEVQILEGDQRDAQGATTRRYYAVERNPVITGLDIRKAKPDKGEAGEPVVLVMLHPEPARAFAAATEANVGSGLAIVLDGRVLSVPLIRSRIEDMAMIAGLSGPEQAVDLAAALTTGPLPTQVDVVSEETTGIPPGMWKRRLRNLGVALIALAALVLYIRHLRRSEERRLQEQHGSHDPEDDPEDSEPS